MPLTAKQHAVYGFIWGFTHQHGYAPTYQEIADALSISKTRAGDLVRALQHAGCISRQPRLPRAITIIGDDPGSIPISD